MLCTTVWAGVIRGHAFPPHSHSASLGYLQNTLDTEQALACVFAAQCMAGTPLRNEQGTRRNHPLGWLGEEFLAFVERNPFEHSDRTCALPAHFLLAPGRIGRSVRPDLAPVGRSSTGVFSQAG